MDRIQFSGQAAFPPTGSVYTSVTCLDGEGTISCEEYARRFKRGDTFFLPARCPGVTLRSEGEALWVKASQNG